MKLLEDRLQDAIDDCTYFVRIGFRGHSIVDVAAHAANRGWHVKAAWCDKHGDEFVLLRYEAP